MKFEKIATEIGKLVEEKNIAYGSSFLKSEKILKILYPDGIKPEQYKDMLAITRIVDKLFRIATKKDAFGESPFSGMPQNIPVNRWRSEKKFWLGGLFRLRQGHCLSVIEILDNDPDPQLQLPIVGCC